MFFNPTYEDNYPTVNLEAEACGTRVITYDAGGARETVRSSASQVIEVGDLQKAIEWMSIGKDVYKRQGQDAASLRRNTCWSSGRWILYYL